MHEEEKKEKIKNSSKKRTQLRDHIENVQEKCLMSPLKPWLMW